MKLFKHTALAAVIALSTSACANLMTVYRAPDLTGRTSAEVRQAPARSLVLDANQHVLLQGTPRPVTEVETRDGGRTTVTRHTVYNVFCAQPSPDAITAVATSGGLNAAFRDTSAETAYALGQSTASIGLRTQAIQLLRDHGYRLCEGYLSGALSEFDFRMLQRRYQNLMTAVLAIEQLTGAVAAQQATVGAQGAATAGDNIYGLVQRRTQFASEIAQGEAEIANYQQILDDANASDQSKREARAEIAEIRTRLESPIAGRAAIDTVLANLDSGTANATIMQNLGAIRQAARVDAAGIESIATAVTNITEQVTQANYLESMCFDYLLYSKPAQSDDSSRFDQLEWICSQHLSMEIASANARNALLDLIVGRLRDASNLTPESLAEYTRLLHAASGTRAEPRGQTRTGSGDPEMAGGPEQE